MAICTALNTLPSSVYRIENGEHNYAVEKAIIYANTAKCEIVVIAPDNKEYVLHSLESASTLLIFARGDKSRYRISKDTGFSQQGLANSESGKTQLSIDMLLKLLEYYGYTITVRPK